MQALIDSDAGLQRSEVYPTKADGHESINMTHLKYNSFLYNFRRIYPAWFSENSIYGNGWRYPAYCFRMNNFLGLDNLWSYKESTFYAFHHFETCLYTISSWFVKSYFLFFIFFFFAASFATIAPQQLGVRGLMRVALASLAFIFFGNALTFFSLARDNRVFFLDIKIYSVYVPSLPSALTVSVDYLSAAFMFLVVAIGLAATMYARVYLYGDPNTPDFIVKLLWFVFSMLVLVISKNIVAVYLSWEFIGITSMWLINFNSQRTDTFKSAIKAFTFNKISDLCLFSGLLVGLIASL